MATEGNDTIFGTSNRDVVYGLGGDDQIFGRGGDDYLNGGTGNDILYGDAGNDGLAGGAGNDTLYGGAGDDLFNAGQGNDLIFGGSGTDSVDYYQAYGPLRVDLIQGVALRADGGTDQLYSIENIYGSLDDDVLIGDGGDNYIDGRYGEDTITLGGGRDTYRLNDGTDAPDTITDFQSGEDTISFKTFEVFRDQDHRPPLNQVLGEQYFIEGTQAETATQYLIFNPYDHTIYYDMDANGSQYAPVALIHLSEGASVRAGDFFMGV